MRTAVILLLVAFISFSCHSKKESDKINVKEVGKGDSSAAIKQGTSKNPYAPVDVSPMDMSYYPADYPKLKMTDASIAPPLARIIYSRPHLQGRKLFQDVLKFGEPWRLGANEATELDLYTDVTIQGKKINAGRYILYCIPEKDKWTIVLNSNIDSWGLHPDAAKDIARFIIPVTITDNTLEYFTMLFQQTASGADLLMKWDNLEAKLSISF
jgi:hypothetical protein